MEAKVIDLGGKPTKQLELPEVFSEPYRPDLIKKAVVVSQANKRQPYGTSPRSGLKTTAESRGAGRGVAMVPRIKNGRRAAKVPQAVGGRKAHPPKPEKKWSKKINKKEARKAIRSAIAATSDKNKVRKRGHIFDLDLPIVVENSLENLRETRAVRDFLERVGLWDDVMMVKEGRRRKSILFVISDDKPLIKAASNLSGVNVSDVKDLGAEKLAPGTHAGRLTVWTETSINELRCL